MVNNTKKITFALYLGYFQENRAKVLSNVYGKSDKISVFRDKSDGVIKFRSRDPMKHMFSKSHYASVCSCQVWWS